MADFQTELKNRQQVWEKFIKVSLWSGAAVMLLMALLWIFVV